MIHQFLIRQVWGGSVDVQNLRVLVRQLRQKIDPILNSRDIFSQKLG